MTATSEKSGKQHEKYRCPVKIQVQSLNRLKVVSHQWSIVSIIRVSSFLRNKNRKASRGETGRPLCTAHVKNGKLSERSELFFV